MPIHRDDDQSNLKPVKRKDLLEVLAGLQPLAEDDWFPDIDDTPQPQAGLPADTNR